MHKAANTLALIRALHTAIYIVMAAAVFALFYASLPAQDPCGSGPRCCSWQLKSLCSLVSE